MSNIIELSLNNLSARIEKGELISFKLDDYEFIHQKGSPGWGSSDTEMFPIIGPVNEANFQVQTLKGVSYQDQHGLLRQMDYDLVSSSRTKASYIKSYVAGREILNSKYPKKSTLEFMSWPYSFEFEKVFELTEQGLSIEFEVSGDKNMPFMLGYHPAFKLNVDNPTVHTKTREIILDEILAVGNRALQIADCECITLRDEKNITIKTQGFGHFMCWTEVRNMVCIEPISFYPYAVAQDDIHKGFEFLIDKRNFKVFLSPSR
jgi:galactose mutarotase-like enzyme